MPRGHKSNPDLAQAFSDALQAYKTRENLSISALAEKLRTTRPTIYAYLNKNNPSAPNTRILKTACIELGLEVKLPGKTIRKSDFLSGIPPASSVASLSGRQMTLPLALPIEVREVFVNLDKQPSRNDRIVLRIILTK